MPTIRISVHDDHQELDVEVDDDLRGPWTGTLTSPAPKEPASGAVDEAPRRTTATMLEGPMPGAMSEVTITGTEVVGSAFVPADSSHHPLTVRRLMS